MPRLQTAATDDSDLRGSQIMGLLADIMQKAARIALAGGEVTSAPLMQSAANAARSPVRRVRTRLPFMDDLTGGGFARGACYLLHGEPGSGKSTLLGQVCASVSGSVYITAEESAAQVGQRFTRLRCPDQCVTAEKNIHVALALCELSPLVVIDSVSTMRPGILPVAEAAVEFARSAMAVVIMVCHETKGGVHAGPRQLEHLIDASLKLTRNPRILTMEKNRFGPAPLAWELTMTEGGLN